MDCMTVADTVGTESLQEQAHRHLLMHFTRNGAFGPDGKPLLVLERGEGAYVFDTDGKRYFDGLSSLFCCQIGYSFGEEMAAVASGAAVDAGVQHQLGDRAPAGDPARRRAGRARARRPEPRVLHQRRLGVGRGRLEDRPPALPGQGRAAAHEGDRARDRLPRRHARRAELHRRAADEGAVRRGADPGRADLQHERATAIRTASDEAALCARLLDEVERTIVETGPETVAMLIAEPVQNAGGCLVPPDGYWPGLRALCDKYGIALVADEVITGFGRIGEWFASSRYGVAPDLITCAKGITSAYAPMGAVLVSDRIAEPLYEDGRMLMHGITFAGHPVAAAIALRNIEIFEREGVLENVRELEPYLGELLEGIKARVPIVGDVRGAGFFWALELVRDASEARFSAEEREKLLRGFIAGRLLEEGLIARPDDRGDAVLHLAPPLISHPRRARGDGGQDRGRAGRRLGAVLRGVIHTAHGYWLSEAGGVEPAPALSGDVDRRRRRHRRRLHRAVDGVAAARARRVGRRCWRPSCAATGRAGATAGSARRCGRTCRR